MSPTPLLVTRQMLGLPPTCYDLGMKYLLRVGRVSIRADQVRDGDYYELTNGHAIECSPAVVTTPHRT